MVEHFAIQLELTVNSYATILVTDKQSSRRFRGTLTGSGTLLINSQKTLYIDIFVAAFFIINIIYTI